MKAFSNKFSMESDIILNNLRNGDQLEGVKTVLEHGLRRGLAPLLRDISHPSDRIHLIHDSGGSRWLEAVVEEGSLEGYMKLLVSDQRTLSRHYTKEALLRNPESSRKFVLILNDHNHDPPLTEGLGGEPTSPVDSGVALPDSEDEGSQEGGKRFEDCELSGVSEGVRRKRVSWHEDTKEKEKAEAETEGRAVSRPKETAPAHVLAPHHNHDPPSSLPPPSAKEALEPPGRRVGGGWKGSLLRRFLRCLPGSGAGSSVPRSRPSSAQLYLGPRTPDRALVDQALASIAAEPTPPPPLPLPLPLATLTRLLCCSTVHKVFKLLSTDGEALLGVLTEAKLFLMGAVNDRCIKRCLDYKDLDCVVVGPGEELVVLVLWGGATAEVVVTEGRGSELCSWLHYSALPSPPHVTSLSLLDMKFLTDLVNRRTGLEGDELSGYVWAEVEVLDCVTASALRKEGHLMVANNNRAHPANWTPAHLSLRSGRLYVTLEERRLCFSVHSLSKCDRVITSRPHTFLLVFGRRSLLVAAPDDYDMSEWMQAVLQASTTGSVGSGLGSLGCRSCAVVVTKGGRLAATPYPHTELIATLPLTSLSAVHTSHTYCLLELGCGEVCEVNSDWAVFFTSSVSLQRFLQLLPPTLPRRELEEKDEVGSKCSSRADRLLRRFDRLLDSYTDV